MTYSINKFWYFRNLCLCIPFALLACSEEPLKPDVGPLPTNDGSLVRYTKAAGEWGAPRLVLWQVNGEFIDINERLKPIILSIEDAYRNISQDLARSSGQRPMSAMAVIVSLDPDLAVLCVIDAASDNPSIPFTHWKYNYKQAGNVSHLRRDVPSNVRETYVGQVSPMANHVFCVDLMGRMQKIDLDSIGDSEEIYADDDTLIKLTLKSPETIQCIRARKGDNPRKSELR